MRWFKKHVTFLEEESRRLSTDSNYKQIVQCRDNFFISHGEIIVRLSKVYRHPILIIYTDATPYQLPLIFPLLANLSIEEVERLSKASINEILTSIKPFIHFYYEFRHQNHAGNLCILEADNLDNGSQYYSITSILRRVKDWFAGHVTGVFPLDNLEMDYSANFRYVNLKLSFLYPEGFLNNKIIEGDFYAQLLKGSPEEERFIYYGCLIDGFNQSGIIEEDSPYLFHKYIDPQLKTSLDYQTHTILIDKLVKENKILRGIWFDISQVLIPFVGLESLIKIIGNGNHENGIRRIDRVTKQFFKILPDYFFVGIRFPNKRGQKEFQIFKIIVKEITIDAFSLTGGIDRIKSILNRYERVEVVNSEKFTEETFHQRNGTRANFKVLIKEEIALFGVGSLGSEIADTLSKAGIGTVRLFDYETMDGVNSVRHLAGINYLGVHKSEAVKEILSDHNPYVNIYAMDYNLYNPEAIYVLGNKNLIISSIADDNLEGFINEHAVIAGKSMFYVRALRGGKAARIFRVIPGKDACFQCLSLYREEPQSAIAVPDDLSLPTIRNECNNPIRPGSAADLKLISSIASRIIIDHLQAGPAEINHWIWSTEPIESVNLQSPFSVVTRSLKPHPKCFYCNHDTTLKIIINNQVLTYLKQLVAEKKGIETGGVLAGIVNKDESILVTNASGPGPNAIHKQMSFSKDIEFCQKFLDNLYKESGERVKYIGEWHSHPDSDNAPSGIDIRSLSEIAQQSNYLTTNPVMIIFSDSGNPSCTIHPAGKRHYFADLNISN